MKIMIGIIAGAILFCSMISLPVFGQEESVIPMPQRVEMGEEAVFVWRLTSVVSMPDELGREAMGAYSEWVRSRSWPESAWLDESTGDGITGEFDPDVVGDEAYRLTVDRSGIAIRASGSAGFFYGVKMLIQILEEHMDGVRATLPAIVIEYTPMGKG